MKYLTLAISCSILTLSTSAFARDTRESIIGLSGSTGCAAGAVTVLIASKQIPHPAKTLIACGVVGAASAGAADYFVSDSTQSEESLKAEDTQDDSKEYISGP